MTPATVRVRIGRVDGRLSWRQEDLLAVEEPLEIRVGSRGLSVTMRTPGHDCELAAGFLLGEEIIANASQILAIANAAPNIVVVELSPDATIKEPTSQRSSLMTSACGVCGKESLEALASNRCPVRCERLQRFFSADAASGGHQERALRGRLFDGSVGREFHDDDIRRGVRDRQNLAGVRDDIFRQQKAGRQFAIMTGRAHGNREAPRADANLKRLFNRKEIFLPPRKPAINSADPDANGGGCHEVEARSSRNIQGL